MQALLRSLINGWRSIMAVIVALVIGFGAGYIHGRSAGIASTVAAQAGKIQERLKDAAQAHDAMQRCLADPGCRLQSDGYRRDQ